MTTQTAEQEAATATEDGSAASKSIDERIAESYAKHSERLGVTTDDAAAKEPESQATPEKAEPEAEAEATTEQEEKAPEARVFTAEELGDPKLYYRLDREGWAALETQHPVLAAGFKALQAEHGRRESAVAAREKALTEKEGDGTQGKTTRTATEARKAAVNGAEIVDAMNDPEKIESGEAIEVLAQHPAFDRVLDKYFERHGIDPNALKQVSTGSAMSTALDLAVNGDGNPEGIPPMEALSDESVQEEMLKESDPRIRQLLRNNDPQVIAFGLQQAAVNAQLRLARKSTGTKAVAETKPDPIAEAAAKAKAAVAKKPTAKGTAMASAAAEGDRKSATSSDDKSLPLDKRIEASIQRNLSTIEARHGRI